MGCLQPADLKINIKHTTGFKCTGNMHLNTQLVNITDLQTKPLDILKSFRIKMLYIQLTDRHDVNICQKVWIL